jgi:hypothetical protein
MNKLSNNAIKYSIQQLFKIAGIQSDYKLKIYISKGIINLFIEQKKIIFNIMTPLDKEILLKGELNAKIIPSFDSKVNVPIFIRNGQINFAFINGNELIVNADIITISFIMLSRFEETLTKERDEYYRYEYKNSLAYKYSFIDVPIVDEYAMLLRKELMKFIPSLNIINRKGNIVPTHDIDFMLRFGNIFRNLKTIIGGDIVIRKNLKIALQSFKQLFPFLKNSLNDPMILGIKKFIDISRTHGFLSVFYFKGLQLKENDCTYDIFIPEVKYCMQKITEAGMKIGIHGGFDSSRNNDIFEKEKNRIEIVSNIKIIKGRQHYLKFDINSTLNIWENNGIKYDSTLGYAEREGFRCGTCHEYSLYNLEKDRPSNVKELPLIVMEGTLFSHRKMNNTEALEKINILHNRCKEVEGDFIFLWHNSSIYGEYKKRFDEVYCKFFENLNKK